MGLGDEAVGIKPDFEHLAPLFIEMKICGEFLHCPHEKFRSMDRVERDKWRLFEEMGRRREIYFAEKQQAEMKEIASKSRVKKSG